MSNTILKKGTKITFSNVETGGRQITRKIQYLHYNFVDKFVDYRVNGFGSSAHVQRVRVYPEDIIKVHA